jgi:hypothetical protein
MLGALARHVGPRLLCELGPGERLRPLGRYLAPSPFVPSSPLRLRNEVGEWRM